MKGNLMRRSLTVIVAFCVAGFPPPICTAPELGEIKVLTHERTQRFDQDPGWDGRNHRSVVKKTTRQDFGFGPTAHAGGKPGEIGGFITPAAEPAFYAKMLPVSTFKSRLSASGTLACTGQAFHALVGFFNAD